MTEKTQEKTLAELAPPDHECRLCGYVYETKKGDAKANVPPGTLFSELPSGWKCPVCAAKPNQFVSIGATNAPSGFQENLNYGFGVNTLTPNQKNLLIFGGLAVGFVFFLSLNGLG